MESRQGGQQGDGHHQGGHQREGDGQGLIAEQAAGDAVEVDDRHEDGHRGQGGGADGPADLLGAADDRLHGAGFVAVAEEGLQDDDGVVDEHADAQDQASQRHDVQLDVEEVHQHEGGDDGDGDDGADVDRVAVVLQKEEQDDEGQDGAQNERTVERLDRGDDQVGLTGDGEEFEVFEVGGHFLEGVLGVAGRLDGVAFGFPVQEQSDGRFVVEADFPLLEFGLVKGPADVFDLDGTVAENADDGLFDLLRRLDLAFDLERVAQLVLLDRAAALKDVVGVDGAGHLAQGQVQVLELFGVDLHRNFLFVAAADFHPGNPFELLETRLDDVFGRLLEFVDVARLLSGHRLVAQDGDQHRRGGRVPLQDDGGRTIVGQLTAAFLDLLLGVQQGEIHIRTPVELQGDDGGAFLGGGFELFEPLDRTQRPFQLVGDEALDLLGTRSRVLGQHGDFGVTEIGQQVDGQFDQGNDAQQDDADVDHDRPDGTFHRQVDDAHGCSIRTLD